MLTGGVGVVCSRGTVADVPRRPDGFGVRLIAGRMSALVALVALAIRCRAHRADRHLLSTGLNLDFEKLGAVGGHDLLKCRSSDVVFDAFVPIRYTFAIGRIRGVSEVAPKDE